MEGIWILNLFRVKAVSIPIVLLLAISSVSVLLVFQEQHLTHRVHFSVECAEDSSTCIINNASQAQFNFTTTETNRSYSLLFDFRIEYTQEYSHQNLSFRLNRLLSLGDDYHLINESARFEVIAPIGGRSWSSRQYMLPGPLEFANMSLEPPRYYTYTGVPQAIQELHISWAFNITSTVIPKNAFLCILTAEFSVIETSDGLNSTTSTTVTVALWVIGIVVLVELNRKRIKCIDERNSVGARNEPDN